MPTTQERSPGQERVARDLAPRPNRTHLLAAERAALERVIADGRSGHGGALVVRGNSGFGKTTLLDHAASAATGFRVVSMCGVASERDLAHAAVHRLCAPMADRMELLPAPQRDALNAAFGERPAADIDRFLLGLAVLHLVGEVSSDRPLLLSIDDAHWLDQPSARILAFVARRLRTEHVVVLFALRERIPELDGLDELVLRGLTDGEALALLASAVPGRLDARVRDRIVAESRGNPREILELASAPAAQPLAGGYGLPVALPEGDDHADDLAARLDGLALQTRRLIALAAAEPEGDPAAFWRAAAELGIDADAADDPALLAVLDFGKRVTFREPRMRSVAYHCAPGDERRRTHHALAVATEADVDHDRWTWHRAHATLAPDADLADDLERAARRTADTGGVAAAAAFLERSALLTPAPDTRALRALEAAYAKFHAGSLAAASELSAVADAGPLDNLAQARLLRLRAKIAVARERANDGPRQLLDAAKVLAPLDVRLARDTYLEAFEAAVVSGRLGAPSVLRDAANEARAAAPTDSTEAADLLLDGLAVRFTDGHAAAAPTLRRAVDAFVESDDIGWRRLALRVAADLWDIESMLTLATRYVAHGRERGALTDMPFVLNYVASLQVHDGKLAAAARLIEEADLISDAAGRPVTFGAVVLAAWRGSEAQWTELEAFSRRHALARRNGRQITVTEYGSAVLYNGLGRYKDALLAVREAFERGELSCWILPEVVEAAARSNEGRLAKAAAEQLARQTQASGTEWALGLEARSLALVTDGPVAEKLYRDAIDRLGRSPAAGHRARAHLLYGEWLRRQRRRIDAREQLQTAYDLFTEMGAAAFAERAHRELVATSPRARKRTVDTANTLTPQEAEIARLAGDGHSNPQIAATLFISARTVEYHLHKVFTKLGIGSRTQLGDVLEPSSEDAR